MLHNVCDVTEIRESLDSSLCRNDNSFNRGVK